MNKTQTTSEQWESHQLYPQQREQQQVLQQNVYTTQQLQTIQQMQRQQQRLATEVTDLRKPSTNNNNNNNKFNYNNIPPPPPPSQQQTPQLPTNFNNRQPHNFPYYYNNYNNYRVPQMQGHMPRQPPRNFSYPQSSPAANNASAEQFETFDPSQRNARTFGFISDFISSFVSPCVNPCTIEAYNQNRCCIVVVSPQPPVCCQYPAPRPQPPIIPPPQLPPRPLPPLPPLPPPLPPMFPPGPPISCCSSCSYGYFGPPPCGYYGGSGVIRRAGGLFGNGVFLGGNLGDLYIGGNLGNLGGGQLSLSIPQTSIFG